MPIIDVTGSRIQAPAGSGSSAQLNCGDLSKILALRGKGKFNKDRFIKSLIGFAIEQMISGPFARIVNNGSMFPQELAGLGAILGVGTLLSDPANAATNMQHLWSDVSGNALSTFQQAATQLTSDGGSFAAQLAAMPKAVTSQANILAGLSAAQQIKDGAPANTADMQAQLTRLCFPYGAASPTFFAAIDAATALKTLAGDTNLPLSAAQRVLGSSNNAMTTSKALASYGVNQQISGAGVSGVMFDVEQLVGLKNLPLSFFSPCGQDGQKAAAILRQACATVDNFYASTGFGTQDWSQITQTFTTVVLSGALDELATTASGFGSFVPDDIVLGMQGHVDSFLARAMCEGGSDNLGSSFESNFGSVVGQGLTAIETVSSIYASAASMTQMFRNSLSVMESMGSGNSIQAILGGNLDALFGLASGQISTPEIVALRALRDCLKQAGSDAQSISIVEAEIKKAEARDNNKWALKLGVFDAGGNFDKAQKVSEAYAKIFDNIIKGAPIRVG